MGMLPLFLSILMDNFNNALLTKTGFAAAFLSCDVEASTIADAPDLNDPFREELFVGEG